jgi:hypothetical protein
MKVDKTFKIPKFACWIWYKGRLRFLARGDMNFENMDNSRSRNYLQIPPFAKNEARFYCRNLFVNVEIRLRKFPCSNITKKKEILIGSEIIKQLS